MHVHGRVRRIVLRVRTSIFLEDTANLCARRQLIDQSDFHTRHRDIATNGCYFCDQVLREVVDCAIRQATS